MEMCHGDLLRTVRSSFDSGDSDTVVEFSAAASRALSDNLCCWSFLVLVIYIIHFVSSNGDIMILKRCFKKCSFIF